MVIRIISAVHPMMPPQAEDSREKEGKKRKKKKGHMKLDGRYISLPYGNSF